jgi:tetratricopeptide (TPR) repeat protein
VKRHPHLAAFLVLTALTAILYAQTLDDEWHYDDSAELAQPGVREGFPAVRSGHYRGAVTVLTWWANHRISGEAPWSYHLVNILIHLVNSMLVYGLAWRLANTKGATAGGQGDARFFAALTAGLLFCAHPLASQAVAYVTQRSTSLATLFFLSALLAYVAARQGPSRGEGAKSVAARTWLILLSLLAFQAGLHTKHLLLTLPVALLLVEALFGASFTGSWRRRLALQVPFWILLALRVRDFTPRILSGGGGAAGAAAEPAPAVTETLKLPSVPAADVGSYAATQMRVIVRYLRLLFLPRGLNLDHDFSLSTSWTEPGVIAAAALIVLLLATAVILVRRAPLVAFGILLFFLTLVPTSSVVPSADLILEHRAYLPLAGFALAAGGALAVLGRRPAIARRRSAAAVLRLGVASLVLVLSVLTHVRARVWDSEISLWSDVVAKSPRKLRPRFDLGLAFQQAGRNEEAIAQYEEALRLEPSHPLVLTNLGNVFRQLGDLEKARALLEEVVALRPAAAEAHLNLGNVHLDRGDIEEADRCYRRALELDRESAAVWYNWAKCHEKRGRFGAAAAAYAEAVRLEPGNVLFLNDLGSAYLALGRIADAKAALLAACARDGRSEVVRYNLALVYEAEGSLTEAVRQYETAVLLNPGFRQARENLAAIRARAGATSAAPDSTANARE